MGARINMFNLLPLWQLDGGRGVATLSRRQRGVVAGVVWAVALAGVDGVFFLVAIAASFRAASTGTAREQGDRNVLLTYLVLVAGLAAIMVGAGKI
jgi:Zn-dependent protease